MKDKKVEVVFGDWGGRPSDRPPSKSMKLFETMMVNLFALLEERGLSAGAYRVIPEAPSEQHRSANFQIHLKSPNNHRPGTFLAVSLDQNGGTIAVHILAKEKDVFGAREEFATAWRACVGESRNIQFTRDGKPAINWPPVVVRSTTSAESSAHANNDNATNGNGSHDRCSSVEVPVQETPVVHPEQAESHRTMTEVTPSPTEDKTEADDEAETSDETELPGLSKFFEDKTNQVLVLSQIIEIAIAQGFKRVNFKDIESALRREWSVRFKVSKVGVSRAIIMRGCKEFGLLRRHRGSGVTRNDTLYSLTEKACEILLKNQATEAIARQYRELKPAATSTVISTPTVTSTPPQQQTAPSSPADILELVQGLTILRANHKEFRALVESMPALEQACMASQVNSEAIRARIAELAVTLDELRQRIAIAENTLKQEEDNLEKSLSGGDWSEKLEKAQERIEELRPQAELFESIRGALK